MHAASTALSRAPGGGSSPPHVTGHRQAHVDGQSELTVQDVCLLRDAHLPGDVEATAARLANGWYRQSHAPVEAGRARWPARRYRERSRSWRTGADSASWSAPQFQDFGAGRAREPGAAVRVDQAGCIPLWNTRAPLASTTNRRRVPVTHSRAHVEVAAQTGPAVGVALARERQAGFRGPSVRSGPGRLAVEPAGTVGRRLTRPGMGVSGGEGRREKRGARENPEGGVAFPHGVDSDCAVHCSSDCLSVGWAPLDARKDACSGRAIHKCCGRFPSLARLRRPPRRCQPLRHELGRYRRRVELPRVSGHRSRGGKRGLRRGFADEPRACGRSVPQNALKSRPPRCAAGMSEMPRTIRNPTCLPSLEQLQSRRTRRAASSISMA